ncbi:MarR family transcriptional regulator [Xenorhabdus szentirmaii]|uniref:MarR family transcriptional regulator n=1 Tax=Xenorhabdus szentirmaii TaxID=290112 RepID=UPI0019AFAB93|nr:MULTISPECIES: MarR family transcriptional regulator [unclassified Xenorhabdus]MBD2794210.1 MarR family transcriptional regulator [Xenorhabdus sp. CUL]MBD2826655.1 MarR family transcriptional regulator [Xenorhabdus sp. 5]
MTSTTRQRELLAAINHLMHLRSGARQGYDEKTLHKHGLGGYSLSELHVIQHIGVSGLLNVTAISQRMQMTRGAISKICAKLLLRSVLEKSKMSGNQKETHFSLSIEGKKVFSEHEKLHKLAEEKWMKVLANYSEEELMVIKRFITDVSEAVEHSR